MRELGKALGPRTADAAREAARGAAYIMGAGAGPPTASISASRRCSDLDYGSCRRPHRATVRCTSDPNAVGAPRRLHRAGFRDRGHGGGRQALSGSRLCAARFPCGGASRRQAIEGTFSQRMFFLTAGRSRAGLAAIMPRACDLPRRLDAEPAGYSRYWLHEGAARQGSLRGAWGPSATDLSMVGASLLAGGDPRERARPRAAPAGGRPATWCCCAMTRRGRRRLDSSRWAILAARPPRSGWSG